jgi:hypothetical protein
MDRAPETPAMYALVSSIATRLVINPILDSKSERPAPIAREIWRRISIVFPVGPEDGLTTYFEPEKERP